MKIVFNRILNQISLKLLKSPYEDGSHSFKWTCMLNLTLTAKVPHFIKSAMPSIVKHIVSSEMLNSENVSYIDYIYIHHLKNLLPLSRQQHL